MMSMRRWLVCALVTLVSMTACAVEPDGAEAEGEDSNESDLYAFKPSLWKIKEVPVCWKNPQDAAAMGWVRDAVAKSWSSVADIRFVGWGACNAKDEGKGVRIRIDDARPHSLFGSAAARVAAEKDTMVLNFTFKKWSPSCQKKREYCVRALAIHEFGHALGFAHEQSRPDTPESCDEEDARDGYGSKGVYLGAYDPNSVMNYCSRVWINGGKLSSGDVSGARKVYGTAAAK